MASTSKQLQKPTRRSERLEGARANAILKQETAAKITKRKRFYRPKQRKTCRLLALPGELRNKIYRYTLVGADRIEIRVDGPSEPPLLQTCNLIRKETTSIYYIENIFVLQVHNFNGAEFLPFSRQIHKYGKLQFKVHFAMRGRTIWDNLVAWLKAHDLYYVLIPTFEDPESPEDFVASGAMKIVEAFPWYMEWESKAEALAGFYEGLRGTGSLWVKEEDIPYEE